MNSPGLLLLPGGILAKSRSPSRIQDSRGWRGQRVTDQAFRDPFWVWHFTSMHYLSLQKRSAGYTATRFKPWPLTSTCNWRHSSKWQNALAGPGPVQSVFPPAVSSDYCWTCSSKRNLSCRGFRVTPVSHLSPIFSGFMRSGLCPHLLNKKRIGGMSFSAGSLMQSPGVNVASKSRGLVDSPSLGPTSTKPSQNGAQLRVCELRLWSQAPRCPYWLPLLVWLERVTWLPVSHFPHL